MTVEPFPPAGSRKIELLEAAAAGRATGRYGAWPAWPGPRAAGLLLRWGHEMELNDLYPWSAGTREMYRWRFGGWSSLSAGRSVERPMGVVCRPGTPSRRPTTLATTRSTGVGLTILGDAHGTPRSDCRPNPSLTARPQVRGRRPATRKPILIAELGVERDAGRPAGVAPGRGRPLRELPAGAGGQLLRRRQLGAQPAARPAGLARRGRQLPGVHRGAEESGLARLDATPTIAPSAPAGRSSSAGR